MIDINEIYLKPTIYNTLNEARGISMECNVEANKIATELRSVVNSGGKSNYLTTNGKRIGIIRKNVNFFDVFGTTLIKWEYYNFDSREWLNRYYEKIPKNDFFDADKNLLSISLFGVSGDLDVRNCENTIAHEIFHNYKSLKPFNQKEHNLAKLANEVVIGKTNTKETQLIGNIMYLLSKEEVQAFCNGAYAQIKKEVESGNRSSIEDFIEKTLLYENFITLDQLIVQFNKTINEKVYNTCCRQINAMTHMKMMSFNSFKKYVETGRKEYLYQIGRLKSMLVDDLKLNESNIIFEKYF